MFMTKQEITDCARYEAEHFTCSDCGFHCRRDEMLHSDWIKPTPKKLGPLCPRCQNDPEAVKLLRATCKTCGHSLLEHPDYCPHSGWAEREHEDAMHGYDY